MKEKAEINFKDLSDREKQAIVDTGNHSRDVGHILDIIISELKEKSTSHDFSKMKNPEFDMFVDFLKDITKYKFGSKEYNEYIESNQYCKHHFKYNDHHPEHFKNGVHDMNLVNIAEMFADWVAASAKRSDCSKEKIVENIIKLCEKFKMGILLTQIFINTVDLVLNKTNEIRR